MKTIMKTTGVILIVFLTLSMCKKPCDRFNLETDDIYHRDGYSFSYNELHEQPNWVFYKITPSDITCHDNKAKRKNNFKPDTDVLTGSATLSDYSGSGYDRGHLKSSADESCDQEQMDETFLMSNMSPQVPSFNRGIWKKLESYVRDIAEESDSVYVYTAGELTMELEYIGENHVSIPNYYYKVIYVFKNGQQTNFAYYLKNEKSKLPLETFLITVEDVENKVLIDFPDTISKGIYPKMIK